MPCFDSFSHPVVKQKKMTRLIVAILIFMALLTVYSFVALGLSYMAITSDGDTSPIIRDKDGKVAGYRIPPERENK